MASLSLVALVKRVCKLDPSLLRPLLCHFVKLGDARLISIPGTGHSWLASLLAFAQVQSYMSSSSKRYVGPNRSRCAIMADTNSHLIRSTRLGAQKSYK